MSRPEPGDRLYWPEADDAGARWIDAPGEVLDGWVVTGRLPPEPFLHHGIYRGRYWERAVYGPPATIWVFQLSDVAERLLGVDPRGGKAVLRRLLRKFGKLPTANSLLFFVIPNSPTWEGPPMRYVLSTIVGKIGTDEGVAHTLKWRTPVENAPLTDTDVQNFANLLRDNWLSFLNGLTGAAGSPTVKAMLPPQLDYSEVRAAYIEQTTPDQAKPPYLVRTKYAPFAANVGGEGGAAPLPYEVAHAVSLNTNFRGPRFRGRMYLGPLTAAWLGTDGQFVKAVADGVTNRFWQDVVVKTELAGWELHVVSRKFVTSARVIGCRSGLTPDAMRSRRRSRPESYTQVGGLAMGAQG